MDSLEFTDLNFEEIFVNDPEFDQLPSFDLVSGSTREFREVDVDQFLQENINKNTKKKTQSDMKVFISFLLARNEARFPEYIPPDALKDYLCQFLLSVTKKDGSEYEPTTLRGFVSSLERYLKEKGSKICIMKDREFVKSQQVLKSKQKNLKSLGLGNKPKAADVLQDHHLETMYNKNVLGDHDGYSLLFSMWLICATYFGMRTGKETHCLKWGDIKMGLDEQSGQKFIQFDRERQTKTRTGQDPKDTRQLKPRAYAYPEDPQRDPVHLYKTFADKRPDDMCFENSPFFLSPGSASQSCWYRRTPMGINKLYGIMNEMKSRAGIEDARITPYSARKRLIQKLNDEGVPPNQIIQISGHKNVNSLNNYSKLNNEQSHRISDIISNKPSTAVACHKNVNSLNHYSKLNNEQSNRISDSISNKPSTAVDIPTATPPVGGVQSGISAPMPGFFVNSNFHGNVTFNFMNKNETQNLSQLTHQVMPPQIQCSVPVPESAQRVIESPIPSPVIPQKRSYKRIRLYPDSDSD